MTFYVFEQSRNMNLNLRLKLKKRTGRNVCKEREKDGDNRMTSGD